MERGPSLTPNETEVKNKKEAPELTKNAKLALELLDINEMPEDIALRALYERSREERRMQTYELNTNADSSRILSMSKLLVGYQHADIEFFEDTIDQIKDFPDEYKPHLINLSGMPIGDFKQYQKNRRQTLVLPHMDDQFKYSRAMLQKASEIGVPMIYNIGADDKRIAEEYVFETMYKMTDYAKPHSGEIGVGKRNEMRTSPLFDELLQFQTHEVFPLNLQLGRRLYTAEEMAEQTDGQLNVDEDLLLFKASRIKKYNEELPEGERKKPMPAGYRQWLNRIEAEKKDLNITFTDDVKLEINTKGKTYQDWIYDNFGGFSDVSKPGNHMGKKVEIMGNLRSKGNESPHALLNNNDYETAGVNDDGEWILSTGPMIDVEQLVDTQGSHTGASGDIARRLVNVRRRWSDPTALMHERTNDGRDKFVILNKQLQEKSESIPERLTVSVNADFQIGSPTFKPELAIAKMDYEREIMMGRNALAMIYLGDHIQGRNYPHFPSESQSTGLMAMDSQEELFLNIIDTAFDDMKIDELKAMERFIAQNGNHEYNSSTLKWTGYSFITSIRQEIEKKFSSLYNRQLAREGYSDEEIEEKVREIIAKKVKTHEAYVTPDGEYVPGYGDIEYFGESDTPGENYGMWFQHSHLNKGGKGSGGNPPAYQADSLKKGLGKLNETIDTYWQQHYHHFSFVVLQSQLSVTGSAFAGLSNFESRLGHRPTPAGSLMHIGGGLPPELEVLSEDYLQNRKIKYGGFSDEQLEEEGYRTDPGWTKRDGIYVPNSPKTARQKKILDMHREASQRAKHITEFQSRER